MLIHEVAQKAGVHLSTVRRLEVRGLITSERDCNGWRRFKPEVVEKIRQLYAYNGEPEQRLSDGDSFA